MKRRDTFRLIPLTFAGIGSFAEPALPVKKENLLAQGKRNPSAMTYVSTVMKMLRRVRAAHSENILEAAYAITRTLMLSDTCWSYWDHGHTHSADSFPGRDGDPGIITIGYDSTKSKSDDLILVSYPFGKDIYDDIIQKKLFLIGGPSPVSGDCIGAENNIPSVQELRIRKLAKIWIDTGITSTGAVVNIPGSPAPLGPVSGPVYLTIWWMMIADACRILSQLGRQFNVEGSEGILSGSSVLWVNLDNPLLDDYFDRVMMQMELLGSEIGEMRKMAVMAAETLTTGGTVYFYSRNSQSLSSEATGRRGGFGFAKGLYNGNIQGSKKDMVIMGITRPDDPDDLTNLKKMRDLGMRTASIGPLTSGAQVPDSATVPKSTDVHVGRFYDTYGLYAIPGFDKKVCPTSGIMNITALWAISVEIAMEIIRRTGNTPGIYYSGSLTWGGAHNTQMRKVVDERGY